MNINSYNGNYNTYQTKTTKNAKTEKAGQAEKPEKEEELDAFKKEMEEYLGEKTGENAYKYNSSTTTITDGAFKRMQTDPEFMESIKMALDGIRMMPSNVRITMTITEEGWSSHNDAGRSKEQMDLIYGAGYTKFELDTIAEKKEKEKEKELDFYELWLQNKKEDTLLARKENNV